MQAGQVSQAMATFQQLQAAGGADMPEALRTLGILVKAGIGQPEPGQDKGLAGLRSHLKPLPALESAELDMLEASLPGEASLPALILGCSPMPCCSHLLACNSCTFNASSRSLDLSSGLSVLSPARQPGEKQPPSPWTQSIWRPGGAM